MVKVNWVLALLIYVLASPAYGSGGLTEQRVKDLLGAVRVSVDRRDVDGIINNFTKDAWLAFDMPAEMGGRRAMTVSEYRQILTQTFALTQSYEYEVTDLTIIVSKDGRRALVTDTITERLAVPGHIIQTRTEETIEVVSTPQGARISRLFGQLRRLRSL